MVLHKLRCEVICCQIRNDDRHLHYEMFDQIMQFPWGTSYICFDSAHLNKTHAWRVFPVFRQHEMPVH